MAKNAKGSKNAKGNNGTQGTTEMNNKSGKMENKKGGTSGRMDSQG